MQYSTAKAHRKPRQRRIIPGQGGTTSATASTRGGPTLLIGSYSERTMWEFEISCIVFTIYPRSAKVIGGVHEYAKRSVIHKAGKSSTPADTRWFGRICEVCSTGILTRYLQVRNLRCMCMVSENMFSHCHQRSKPLWPNG